MTRHCHASRTRRAGKKKVPERRCSSFALHLYSQRLLFVQPPPLVDIFCSLFHHYLCAFPFVPCRNSFFVLPLVPARITTRLSSPKRLPSPIPTRAPTLATFYRLLDDLNILVYSASFWIFIVISIYDLRAIFFRSDPARRVCVSFACHKHQPEPVTQLPDRSQLRFESHHILSYNL